MSFAKIRGAAAEATVVGTTSAEQSPRALERYRKTEVHFVDCLLAATAAAEDAPVATFDQDFRKFADVRVETH